MINKGTMTTHGALGTGKSILQVQLGIPFLGQVLDEIKNVQSAVI